MMRSTRYVLAVVAFAAACGSDASDSTNKDAGVSNDAGPSPFVTTDGGNTDAPPPPPAVPMFPELWYTVDQWLVRVELADDGKVKSIKTSDIALPLHEGQSAITMLNDGSLLFTRLSSQDKKTYFFHVATPPRDGSAVTPTALGVMPNDIMIEGLYTDCEARLYAMDTGSDDTNAQGNRLLRLTGNVRGGDFTFAEVSNLSGAATADIDDMGPAIGSDNKIVDNPGLAIDTGHIYAFNFETGAGNEIAQAGTYGIHALGGSLFADKRSRLYVMNSNAELFELDPTTHAPSSVLAKGPVPSRGVAGWSSLTGPLTDCAVSGFVTQPK